MVIERITAEVERLSTEAQFVIARAEAKGVNHSQYFALLGLKAAFLQITANAYGIDHAESNEHYADYHVGIYDAAIEVQKCANVIAANTGRYADIGRKLATRAESIISAFTGLHGGSHSRQHRIISKKLPREIAKIHPFFARIDEALQSEKCDILSA